MRCVLPAHRDLPENPWEWACRKEPVLLPFLIIQQAVLYPSIAAAGFILQSAEIVFVSLGLTAVWLISTRGLLSEICDKSPWVPFLFYPLIYLYARATGWASKTRIDLHQYRRETAELLQAQAELYRLELADFDRRLNEGRQQSELIQEMVLNQQAYIRPGIASISKQLHIETSPVLNPHEVRFRITQQHKEQEQ